MALLGSPPSSGDEHPVKIGGKTVAEWTVILRDEHSPDRDRAALALGCLGPDARSAVPDLITAAGHPGHVRFACDALGRIGMHAELAIPLLMERIREQSTQRDGLAYANSDLQALARIGAPAVPILTESLTARDEAFRPFAADALGRIGPPAKAAVPSLIWALSDEAQRDAFDPLRYKAVVALGRIGPEARPAIPALERLFADNMLGEWEPFHELVQALDRLGSPPVDPLLAMFLGEKSPYAATELAGLGPRAGAAVPRLRAALADPRIQVRVDAAVALAWIAPPAPESLPVLIDALKNHPDEATAVPAALGHLGPFASAAIPALIAEVERGNALGVYTALIQVDPQAKQCLRTLITGVNGDEPDDVYEAIECLSLLGPRAAEAAPALAITLTRKNEGFSMTNSNPQIAAAKALGRIGPNPATMRALVGALGHRGQTENFDGRIIIDTYAADSAATALGSFGPEAKEALPELIACLAWVGDDDDTWSLRRSAALALGRIGPDAKLAIPALRALLQSENPDIRDAARVALVQIDPSERADLEDYTASISEPERRAFLLGGLGRADFEADALVRISLENLDLYLEVLDESLPFLEEWFEQVGRFGQGSRAAIPRLSQLRSHPNPWVRLWATETLERILGDGRK